MSKRTTSLMVLGSMLTLLTIVAFARPPLLWNGQPRTYSLIDSGDDDHVDNDSAELAAALLSVCDILRGMIREDVASAVNSAYGGTPTGGLQLDEQHSHSDPTGPRQMVGSVNLIYADQGWQETGIDVDRHYKYIVDAYGDWGFNPVRGEVPPSGDRGIPPAREGYVLDGYNEGALIGKIGVDGKPFYAGPQAVLPKDQDGRLYLVINDDLEGKFGKGLSDNWSAIAVEVEVE